MGKRHRKQHAQQAATNTRARVEAALARGDSREAVEAGKLLLRESPGTESEALAVRAYLARIRSLMAEGLGREAGAMAAIVRERFPAHVASCATELEDARLAAGDFDWLLRDLAAADPAQRAAIEERLLPWIADPGALRRSQALAPGDPLVREAAAIAEVFEIVTARHPTDDELARMADIRRRSPLAPWKLLVRAIDAFHRNDDDRTAANVTAIDPRSPAARAGTILSELIGSRKPGQRSFATERLVERISGERTAVAGHLRAIESARQSDDRRRLREEVRSLVRTFDRLSPFAREQARIALLDLCGADFSAEQVASFFRVDPQGPEMPRYAAVLMERNGAPFASSIWIAYAEDKLASRELQPWQVAEIYMHALDLGELDDIEDPFACNDPTHGHPVDDSPDTADVIGQIIALDPAPPVFARLIPHLDRLDAKELRRILTAWRKRDPKAPEPLVRLLQLAHRERKYDDALSLIRKGDEMKILDPEYARLRQGVIFRRVEQMLGAGSRGAPGMLLEQIGVVSEDARLWLLALQWAAAPPAKAGELLAEILRRGVPGEIVMAEITGLLRAPYALPASQASPEELLEGVQRGSAVLHAAGREPSHSAWIVQRVEPFLDRATEGQLLTAGATALVLGLIPLAWKATARGLSFVSPILARVLMLRAEILLSIHADPKRTRLAIEAARTLALNLHDTETVQRGAELAHRLPFYGLREEKLSQRAIDEIVELERKSPEPVPRSQAAKKTRRKKAPPKKKAAPKPAAEKGLFEP